MRKINRLAMLGLSVIATSGLVAGTASAETATAHADKFAARATADAMTIDLFGTRITGSNAVADLDANPQGTATVRELVLGGPMDSGDITAHVEGVGNLTDVKTLEACFLDELEAIPGIRRVDITCPEARAAIAGNLPSARALGAEVVLEPSVSMVLETLGLDAPVNEATTQLNEQLIDPLVEAITGSPLAELPVDETVQTVQDVLQDTLTLNSTARVVVAPALAEVTSDAEKIVSTAHAQGIRIELLPVDELGATNGLLPDDLVAGEPLVTITIGEAKATCTYFRAGTGSKDCPPGEASAVKIELGTNALSEALGINGEVLSVEPGVEQCILADTPLETCISVAAAGADADGNPYANATSVSLFKGINGGINVATGSVTAGSAGAPAAAAPAVVPDLPRTGAESNVAIMGAGLLGLAVLVRRIAVGRA